MPSFLLPGDTSALATALQSSAQQWTGLLRVRTLPQGRNGHEGVKCAPFHYNCVTAGKSREFHYIIRFLFSCLLLRGPDGTVSFQSHIVFPPVRRYLRGVLLPAMGLGAGEHHRFPSPSPTAPQDSPLAVGTGP